MNGRRGALVAVGALALALAAAACGGGGAEFGGGGGPGNPDGGGAAPGFAASPAPAGKGAETHGDLGLGLPAIGPKIIKNATVRLELRNGTFDERFQEAASIAARHGGFVSTSRTEGAERRSGTLVLRIPAPDFEAAVGELKGLGKVLGESLTGEDVTAEYVDLQARLRNWEAQEAVLLRLMRQADTIDDSIRVQRELQNVQLTIEQLRGQLRVLNDQTAMSTVTLSMAEQGAAAAEPRDAGGLPSVTEAWQIAINGFLAVIAALVISVGYVAPFVLFGTAAWFAWRRWRARLTPATASPRA